MAATNQWFHVFTTIVEASGTVLTFENLVAQTVLAVKTFSYIPPHTVFQVPHEENRHKLILDLIIVPLAQFALNLVLYFVTECEYQRVKAKSMCSLFSGLT
jgi:hypothetical protein